MSAAHTPGVWGDKGRSRHQHVCIPLRAVHCERLGFYVAFVSDERNGEPEANARLIAAAPELLAALKSCAAVCAGETLNKSALVNALEQARAAIAKAESA